MQTLPSLLGVAGSYDVRQGYGDFPFVLTNRAEPEAGKTSLQKLHLGNAMPITNLSGIAMPVA